MISIWLCDDEPLFLDQAAANISSIFTALNTEIAIRTFITADALVNALHDAAPDLLLLDLMLGDADGYAVAEEICRHAPDTELVFVTNYPEQMDKAFAYRPIGFIQKPADEKALFPVMERFMFFYRQKHETFSISTRSMEMHVPLRDILFFESALHQIHLHTTSQKEPIVFPGKLDQIDHQLAHSHFIRCHKSFLVSTKAIFLIDKRTMTLHLHSRQTLPISRRYYTAVSDKFAEDKAR